MLYSWTLHCPLIVCPHCCKWNALIIPSYFIKPEQLIFCTTQFTKLKLLILFPFRIKMRTKFWTTFITTITNHNLIKIKVPILNLKIHPSIPTYIVPSTLRSKNRTNSPYYLDISNALTSSNLSHYMNLWLLHSSNSHVLLPPNLLTLQSHQELKSSQFTHHY